MQQVEIERKNIKHLRFRDVCKAPLREGQVRLAIRSFALTANNVTYAATGDVIGYWKFFPATDAEYGVVPVWGFAEVVETRSQALELGARVYGFWPMASEAVLLPKQKGGILVDQTPHRADLPPVYNQYYPVQAQSFEEDAYQALLQPLLATSYLLCDWLEDNDFFGAEQILIGSASSKTGAGLAMFLAQLSQKPKIIGLTSPGNADFVRDLNVCDEVVLYDDISCLASKASVFVDMAGNAAVREQVHAHLGDNLKHSSAVGTSHWDKFNPRQQLAGPKPQFFFAPAQIEKRRADWGSGVIDQKIKTAWKEIAASAAGWLNIVPIQGLNDAVKVYVNISQGHARPSDGYVVQL